MKSNAREIAVRILDNVLYKGAYSNIALNTAFSSANLDPLDSGLAAEIVYGTLTYLYNLDRIIEMNANMPLEKIDKKILNILRSAIYQIKYLDRVPEYAVINEAVEITKIDNKKASGFVNGVLRGYLRNQDKKMKFKNEKEKFSVTESFPIWLIDLLKDQYKNNYIDIIKNLNDRGNITLRVNTLISSRKKVLENLLDEGFEVKKTEISPYGIEVISGKSIFNLNMFRDGEIIVQDESSMLVAPQLVNENDDNYIDMCSAPGGKVTHIAELTKDQKNIYAFDIYDNKIRQIKENKNRLKINSIEEEKRDARIIREDLEKSASVLLDAPCSGLGIIKSKPEIKYNVNLDKIESLIILQRELLEAADKYVKKGSFLVYSTCTLNKKENEENIKWFLEKYPSYKLVDTGLKDSDNILTSNDYLKTILPTATMDGFFIAKLKKLDY